MVSNKLNVRVQRIDDLADGVRAFELVPVEGTELPAFTAGAHIDLHLPPDLVRSYSLYNNQDAASAYQVAVALDPNSRGGSRFLFEQVSAGQTIAISPPTNHFALVEDAPHTVLVAGGIGITPLWAMAQRLTRLGRPWTLHYAARRAATAAFREELAALAAAGHGQVHFSFGDDPQRRYIDLQQVFRDAPAGTHFYCCGPQKMIDGFLAAGQQRPSDTVHVEFFEGVAPTGADEAFTVELAKSGKTLQVPKGQTILEVVEQAGIQVAHACKEGVCAACEVRVIDGLPDHRDLVLSKQEKAENKSMMICCSGSLSSRLILDL